MKDVQRNSYLNKVKPFIGQPTIKAITGVRRCGKSFMMRLIGSYLETRGIPESRILRIDLDDFRNNDLLLADRLFEKICSSLENVPENEKMYIFVDEPQYVDGWEKVIATVIKDPRADVFVTGSNSKMLSSDLSTLITGRYVTVRMNPLSFTEYIDFRSVLTGIGKENLDTHEEFIRYRRIGGFPLANIADYDVHASDMIVRDILESIISNDIVKRSNIRRRNLLERIILFTLDNVGNPYSTKSLVESLGKAGMKADVETVSSYLALAADSYLVIPVKGYNIRGSTVMESVRKYYAADVSLIYAGAGYKSSMLSGIEENIVAVDLMRRGFEIYVGQTRSGKEVDFVAVDGDRKVYVQVTHSLEKDSVRVREVSALRETADQYHKYIVVGEGPSEDIDGISAVPIDVFLLKEEL